jgi:flagellar hook-associated protein 2
MSSSTGINLNGINLLNGQGIDVSSIVSQMVTAASVPETQWQSQQSSIQGQISDLNVLQSSTTTLENDLAALQDPVGSVTSRSVTSSDSSLVSASASAGSAIGNHTVVVNSLATTSSYYTGEVASATTTLASGTFDLSVGGGTANTITIDSSDNTLTGLASAINNQNLGVTASVVTDANGARLALVSQSSGAAGDLSVTNASSGLSFGFTKAATGTNASLAVDGVPVSSASNTVTGALTGLTLNLNGAAPNTTVNISVAPDTSAVTNAVTSFVNDYNTLIGQVNTEYAFDTSTNSGGPLQGDSTVEMLQSTLLGSGGYTAGGSSAVNTLADLGITMNDDGTLTLNSSTLNNAISNNYSAVQTFLQGDGTGTNGFASQFATQLGNLTNPVEGAFSVDLSGYNATVSSLQDQINDFQTYITAQQTMWTAQYDQMNVTLQELPEQQEAIQAELGNSNYANTNNG